MNNTYTVKPGDNLSTIAQRYGVGVNQITGYKSGNPNMIQPGEVLTIGGSPAPGTGAPKPTPTITPPVQPTPQMATQPTPTTATPGSTVDNNLVNALIAKGYNPTDAKNKAASANANLYKEYGVAMPGTAAPGAGIAGAPKTLDVQSIYNAAINTPEIQAANRAIGDKQAEIAKVNADTATAIANISDNPFMSEATMTGKIAKINKAKEERLSNLNAELNSLTGNYNNLQQDAKTQVDLATKNFDIQSTVSQQNISKFNTLLSNGSLSGASSADIANFASSLGIPTSMVQSAINKQKKDNIKTEIKTYTDNSGNVTVAVLDSATGDIISKKSLGTIDASKNTASSEKTNQQSEFVQAIDSVKDRRGYISPEDWKGALSSWVSRGRQAKDFIENFQHYADPARSDFETAYGFKRPSGIGL